MTSRSANLKVLHVEAGMHLYGGALQVCFLTEGLAAHGVTSLLACPPGSAVGDEARRRGVAVAPLVMKGDADVGLVWRLRQLIRQWRPDVLHLHSRRGCDVWGTWAGRLAGVPVVLSRRVDNPEPAWWAQRKYRWPNRVVTISQGIRQVLLSEGVPAERVVCVPSAVDTQAYQPDPRAAAVLRAEFALPADALVIGMAAQFIERKGHRTLLQALPQVIAQHPSVRVLLFGQGPLLEPLRQQVAADALLRQHVSLPGFRADLMRWLPGLDVLAHPASMEGLGVALLQAAACGVPIVAGRAGGIPEIVVPGLTGELITPGDVPALAGHLQRLLDSAELRHRYGQAGRERVLTQFSIPAMVAGNLAVYRALVAS